jgi:DNA-binding MarR family transcriptional regulator
MTEDRIDWIVSQWRRERPDVDTNAMALVGRIQRAAAELRPRLDATHARFGLTGESFDVLASLRRAGAPYELTPTQLYTQLMLSSGAVTNRIDRLEADGLVERRPDPNDRRGTRVRLTSRGKQLIDRAVVQHVANEASVLSALTEKEQTQLGQLLRKLLLHLERSDDSD